MKTLSLLGALFLPGTYLASVFSMTFFNFEKGNDAYGKRNTYPFGNIMVR